jgi:integrase
LLIGNWINEYLEEAKDRFVRKTFKEKRATFVRLIEYAELEPDFPIENITIMIVRKFFKKQFKERSGYAANKDRKNLGTAWNWGMDNIEGWPTVQNPFLSVKKFPEIRKPRYVPPEDDFWRIYDVAEGQDRIMLLAILHLAARRSEIFRLKWSDVDFSNNRVRLSTRKREGGNLEYDWLPMTSELREALHGWRRERMVQSTIDKEHLFVCLDETPFCDNYYGRPFTVRQHFMKKICQRAGVKPFGFHAIRHLTASILYRKGYSQAHIQAVLRHKNPNTTARYLRTLGLEEARQALEHGLRGPARIIPFQKGKTPRNASSEG